MKLEIPAQLRGIDAGPVMSVANSIQREFVEAFEALGNDHLTRIRTILRVGGEMGTFGVDTIKNIKVSENEAVCDLVIDRRKWRDMSDDQIAELLRPMIIDALCALLRESGFEPFPLFLLDRNNQAQNNGRQATASPSPAT